MQTLGSSDDNQVAVHDTGCFRLFRNTARESAVLVTTTPMWNRLIAERFCLREKGPLPAITFSEGISASSQARIESG